MMTASPIARRYITVRQAAARLGVVPQRVRALIAAGRISGIKVGRAWLIARRDLDSLEIDHSRRPRRGPKSRSSARREPVGAA